MLKHHFWQHWKHNDLKRLKFSWKWRHNKPATVCLNPSEYYYIIFFKTFIVYKKILKVLKILWNLCRFFNMIWVNENIGKYLTKNCILSFESVWIGSLCKHSCFTKRWLVKFDDVSKYRPMRYEYQICSNRNFSLFLQKTCRRVIARKIQSKTILFSFEIRNQVNLSVKCSALFEKGTHSNQKYIFFDKAPFLKISDLQKVSG